MSVYKVFVLHLELSGRVCSTEICVVPERLCSAAACAMDFFFHSSIVSAASGLFCSAEVYAASGRVTPFYSLAAYAAPSHV